MQTWREHINSMQMLPLVGFESNTPALKQSNGANHWATMILSQPNLLDSLLNLFSVVGNCLASQHISVKYSVLWEPEKVTITRPSLKLLIMAEWCRFQVFALGHYGYLLHPKCNIKKAIKFIFH